MLLNRNTPEERAKLKKELVLDLVMFAGAFAAFVAAVWVAGRVLSALVADGWYINAAGFLSTAAGVLTYLPLYYGWRAIVRPPSYWG